MTQKLSKNDWLNLSLRELARNGHSCLTANRLAKTLGVSRGSFYWHFKDVESCETEILKRWAELTTEEVIEDLRVLETPRLRLIELIKQALNRDMKLERAVRSWSITDKKVAKEVQSVDERRVNYILNILRVGGVADEDLQTRAHMLNWASIGRMMMSENDDSDLLSIKALERFADLLLS